jgi:hypothetical protein
MLTKRPCGPLACQAADIAYNTADIG